MVESPNTSNALAIAWALAVLCQAGCHFTVDSSLTFSRGAEPMEPATGLDSGVPAILPAPPGAAISLGQRDTCWEGVPLEESEWRDRCMTRGQGAQTSEVSLSGCVHACLLEPSDGCGSNRVVGYSTARRRCILAPTCDGLPKDFVPHAASGCVVGQLDCSEIRSELPSKVCDALPPSEQQVNDVDAEQCMLRCMSDRQCAAAQTFVYNPDARICLVDPSCVPPGFGQFRYQALAGCAPRNPVPTRPTGGPIRSDPEDASVPDGGGPGDSIDLGRPETCFDAVSVEEAEWQTGCDYGSSDRVGAVSLSDCARACLFDPGYTCRYSRRIGFSTATSECILAPGCGALPEGFLPYLVSGCVVGQIDCREIRSELPSDGCGVLDPSVARLDDVDATECLRSCDANPECARRHIFVYNPKRRVCALEPSCIPDGFGQFRFQPSAGCEP